MVLTPSRLTTLAQFPHLQSSWFFLAAATLSICNKPQEIPKLYQFALKVSQYNAAELSSSDYTKLAQDALERNETFIEINSNGEFNHQLFKSIENLTNRDPILNQSQQLQISLKFREAILKSAALGGIPKAINSLVLLKNCTSLPLRSTSSQRNFDPIETESQRLRGEQYWNKIYGKISRRVINQLNQAYPDLWLFAKNHLYAPLLSYTEVLNPKESSLLIIACLIPQDVNPQLKGHLRGAINQGCSIQEIESCRELSLLIGDYCGVKWSEPVAKLKL